MFMYYLTGLGKSFSGQETAEAVYDYYQSKWSNSPSTSIFMVPPAIGEWDAE